MKNIIRKLVPTIGILTLILALLCGNAFAEANVAVSSSEFYTHQGETFTTTIYIPDGANIVDFDITLKYDTELLTLVSASENEDAKGTVIFNAENPGEIAINYTRTNKNVTTYLPLLDLTFTVDDNIGIGSYDCLSIDPSAAYVAHRLNDAGTLDQVDFACDFAKLVIYEMGDVDLSGSVDIGDATYIRRHLAQFTGAILSEYKLSLADTFCDGIVDIADAVCLQRHLARLDVLYGNRINVTFYDMRGEKYAAKSVVYNGTLYSIPAVPKEDGFSGGMWSLSADEYIAPVYSELQSDVSLYAYYSEKANPAMDYYKKILTNMYYSGDMPTNLSSNQKLQDELFYQDGWYASLVWSSDCNYILNSTTGAFTKPTYPQKLTLTISITSYDSNNKIDSEGEISFEYDVPGIYLTPTKASVEDFLKHYFTDNTDGKYRVNYDVKLISKLNNTVIPVEGAQYDNFEIRLAWYQNVDGTLVPVSQIKRTASSQTGDFVAVATFNGKPLEDDGKIYIDNVEITAIEQIEIKNYIIMQIAANMGTLATDGTKLWNNDTVYGTNVTWETGNSDIAYVANNVIQLKDDAVSGSTLPLNARVSYAVDGGVEEFVLSYNLTVSCDNTIIKAPENMDTELYKAIKTELEDTLGYRGDLTSAALANVKFVNLDLSDYPEISSLRGLSYCKNLRTLNISGLHITDGTMNQIATLSYLEAFIARNCGLDNLTDGGQATLRNAVNLKLLDLTSNNFTSLDSVFAEGIRYGKLREVYLANNQLEDINALSRAPLMSYLSLANNGLTTEGTAAIANYPYLFYLSLADNEIDSVEHLKNLSYLKELRLQNNNLSNVNDLRRLVNLQILYLGNNKIQDIGNLNTLTQLEILYVNDNQIFDISALRDLTKLEAINVSNNQLSSLSVLSNYKTTLTEIYAENNNVTDFSFINGAVNLHILMLAGNEAELAQSNMTTWLGGLTGLEILTLSDIRLNDLAFLEGMEKLARLDVDNCGLNAFSGEISNIQMIADCYATLKVLDISNNDLSDGEQEILKLRDVTLLTVFYADNICNSLDAYTLTYSMTELKYISLENCGISAMNWLYKFNNLAYVDLAGNHIADVSLETHFSNASIKTLKELYLDTDVTCSFANAYRVMDFNVEKLSLEGISVAKMENLPYLDNVKYLNLSKTGLTNLTGADADLTDLYSIERYENLEVIDVSYLETDISTLENMESLTTVYAVGTTDSKLFHEGNLHSLQRMYNNGITCYLYDKNTKYEPIAAEEGSKILSLIEDFSCDVTIAADKVISDNNPLLLTEINDFDITWSVSNSDNYEITNNRLAVKSYTGLEDETLLITAEITVYPDQKPVTRDFEIRTHILRAETKYFAIDATGFSEQLTRDAAFTYSLTLKAAETEGFSVPVKPVEDAVTYSYKAVNEEGTAIPYPNVLTVKGNNRFAIATNAPLNATVTICIDISHTTKSGTVIKDVEQITIPIVVASRTFTVKFVMNGGKLVDANGLSRESCEFIEDALIFEKLRFSRTGYSFGGWYKDSAFTSLFSADGIGAMMPSENITLYAKWNPISYNVYFNANGGSVGTASITALSDVALGELPTPTRQYYTFDGWFTAASGGDKVTASTKFARSTDITLYAHWTLNSFVVTFDPNADDASVSTSSLRVYCGKALGTLPTPTRDYYTFVGWFTTADGGEEITADSVFTSAKDMTVYAKWRENAVSEWVPVSELPADAQVVDRKWTYTLTSYTTSSSSSLSGWTHYNTTSAWSDYGAWSSWSTTAAYDSDSRDAETKSEHTGYNMIVYNTKSTGGSRQFRSYSIAGKYSSYGCSSTYGEFNYSMWASVSTINSATTVASGKYTSACTYPGYNKDSKTGYVLTTSWGDKYVFFISSNTYTTYYRYRDRSLVYTYYFYKTEAKEATSAPTGENISDVQELVRYRAK